MNFIDDFLEIVDLMNNQYPHLLVSYLLRHAHYKNRGKICHHSDNSLS